MGTMPDESSGETRVPLLVGLDVRLAREVGDLAGLVVVGPRPDGPPLAALTFPGSFVVTDQRPSPGARVRRGDMVVVEFRRRGGGESGDREPLLPYPSSGILPDALDLPGGEPPGGDRIDAPVADPPRAGLATWSGDPGSPVGDGTAPPAEKPRRRPRPA